MANEKAVLQLFGAWVAHCREEHGKTQADVAKKAGISRRTVNAVEVGEGNYGVLFLLRVCNAVGVDLGLLTDPAKLMLVEKHIEDRKNIEKRNRVNRLREELAAAEADLGGL